MRLIRRCNRFENQEPACELLNSSAVNGAEAPEEGGRIFRFINVACPLGFSASKIHNTGLNECCSAALVDGRNQSMYRKFWKSVVRAEFPYISLSC